MVPLDVSFSKDLDPKLDMECKLAIIHALISISEAIFCIFEGFECFQNDRAICYNRSTGKKGIFTISAKIHKLCLIEDSTFN